MVPKTGGNQRETSGRSLARDVAEGVLERLRGREPLGRVEHQSLLEEVGELQHLARVRFGVGVMGLGLGLGLGLGQCRGTISL